MAREAEFAMGPIDPKIGLVVCALGVVPLVSSLQYGLALAADDVVKPTLPAIEVQVRDGLLTLDARNVPLEEVLRALGKSAGFKVMIIGELKTPTTRSMSSIPVSKGIRRLIGDTTWIMLHDPSGGHPRTPRPVELRVYASLGAASEAAQGGPRTAGRSRVAGRISPTVGLEESIVADLARSERGARIRALRSLHRLDASAALDILVGVLSHDEDQFILRWAVTALGRVGGDQAAEQLEALLDHEMASVRLQALRALGTVGDDRAIQTLGQVLLEESDRHMRWVAGQVLAQQRSGTARALLEVASSDRDLAVQQVVRRALGDSLEEVIETNAAEFDNAVN